MRNLEQDLRFFEQELERERDPFRRNLILGQICEIKQEILNNLRRERAQAERENRNLQEALEAAIQMKKKWFVLCSFEVNNSLKCSEDNEKYI